MHGDDPYVATHRRRGRGEAQVIRKRAFAWYASRSPLRCPDALGGPARILLLDAARAYFAELLAPSMGAFRFSFDEWTGHSRHVEALRRSGDTEAELPKTLLGATSRGAGHARLVDPRVERGSRDVSGPSLDRREP